MFSCSLLRYEDNNTVPVLAKVNCRFSGNSDYGEDHILRCSSSAEIEDIQCEVGDEVFIECGEKIEELLSVCGYAARSKVIVLCVLYLCRDITVNHIIFKSF